MAFTRTRNVKYMLWYFGKKPIEQAYAEASQHYQQKYNKKANRVFINPKVKIPNISVKAEHDQQVHVGYLLIGHNPS